MLLSSHSPPPVRPRSGLLDVAATRQLLQALLAGPGAGAAAFVYCLDKEAGARWASANGGDAYKEAAAKRNQALLRTAVHGLPAEHVGAMLSGAIARPLRLGARFDKLEAVKRAAAVFPQAAPQVE